MASSSNVIFRYLFQELPYLCHESGAYSREQVVPPKVNKWGKQCLTENLALQPTSQSIKYTLKSAIPIIQAEDLFLAGSSAIIAHLPQGTRF